MRGLEFDVLPWPARQLLPEDSIVSTKLVTPGRRATTIIASRGCGQKCSFCAAHVMWGRRVRYRPVRDVILEIEHLQRDYGIEELRFQDDSMTSNQRWLVELCEAMPYGLRWRCNARVDQVNRDLLALMREAGCTEVGYGVESVEQEVLNACQKHATVEAAGMAIHATREAGLKSRLFLIVGLPLQNLLTVFNTLKFISRTQPDAVDVSTLVPFPGSDLWRDPSDYGFKLKHIDWSDYVMTRGLFGDEQSKEFVFEHPILSDDQLRALRSELLEYVRSYNLVRNG